MSVCPYEQLQVPHASSLDECKLAFKRLAKLYHPDINKTPEAVILFKACKEALDYLSDPYKKRMLDMTNINTPSVTFTSTVTYTTWTIIRK